ncbi:hypothetical protein Kpho02_72660 [Kitasatospora phosalacinea]|uniref:Uncharacterized protein n=1 Tax=Kitasatospora phosalacinea TaxID=2065 RepID=A0A9W6QF42_9ACTN|nr:hypothetical protein [Kitasatospora phosalacinea]GLW74969.1 hypothetical protein Kpho02_72660 [Kitasatospora phosalacinea]
MTQTGRNVEQLLGQATRLLEDSTTIKNSVEALPEHIEQQAQAVLSELRTHRDQLIGVISKEQSESARYHRESGAQQKRIEELLEQLGELRLQAATGSFASEGARLPADSGPDDPARQEAPAAAPEEPAPVQHAQSTAHFTAAGDSSPSVTSTEENLTVSEPAAFRSAVDRREGERLLGGTADLIPPVFVWSAHVATLRKASAIHTLTVECHPHTWDFLNEQVRAASPGGTSHFNATEERSREWDRPNPEKPFTTDLSGRSTVALLNALHATVHRGVEQPRDIETWSLAVTSYERIAEVVAATRPRGEHDQQESGNGPRVVLDDRTAR